MEEHGVAILGWCAEKNLDSRRLLDAFVSLPEPLSPFEL